MAIQNTSVLVDLHITAWTGRKLDKKVSGEIDASKNTKTRAGNYHKHLLAGTDKLETVQRLAGALRTWHHENTLPWSDGGSRLLPMKNFFDYKQELSKRQREFDVAVQDFLDHYPELVSSAAFQLGALFNRTDYPEVEDIKRKFYIGYVFMPVPTANDFRIETTDETIKELQAQADAVVNERVAVAMKEMWDRLHDQLTHMSDKLTDLAQPRVNKKGEERYNQVFRDSLVTNAIELCGLLTRLNVTNDPKLEQARLHLEKTISGVTAEALRDDDLKRAEVKAEVDAILKAFEF
jgi:hypothetical protein